VTARRTLLEKGRRETNTRAIVRTAITQRDLIDVIPS
jgi:putative transposase